QAELITRLQQQSGASASQQANWGITVDFRAKETRICIIHHLKKSQGSPWLACQFIKYHPSRVLTIVYQPFALGTLAILTYKEAKINTRRRNLFGYIIFSTSALVVLVVSTIIICITSSTYSITICWTYIGICIISGAFGVADAHVQGGMVGDLSFMLPEFTQVMFVRMPLQFAEDLDILLSNAAATTEWAYTPSSRVMPQTDETAEEFHTPHDAEFHDDADLEVVHPSELNKKWSSNTDGSSTKSTTKNKFTGAALLNKTLDCIVNVVESSSVSSTQTSSRYPSIAECLAKLESIRGVSPDDELYVWAARLFLRDKRQ
ncbi:Equilibrative nucleotide transporter 2, partial [Camellia lanceoleosa]